jgi:hypothetical protein
MKQREDAERPASPAEGQQAVRKPYRKPAVRYERVFETSAFNCGKVQTTQSQCRFNRKTS